MRKREVNQSGFGLSAILIALVVVVTIGALGVIVYKSRQPAADTPHDMSHMQESNSPNDHTADPHAALQNYQSDDIAFQYPATWVVEDVSKDTHAKQWVRLVGPIDKDIEVEGSMDHMHHAGSHRLVVMVSPISSPAYCHEACTIYDSTTLSAAKSNSRLVISDWDSQGSAQALEVIDHDQAMVGAKKYKLGATMSGRQVRISGSVRHDGSNSPASIKDVAAFKHTTSFGDLVKLINSVTIQE